jgi:hypothetical protein
MIAETVAADRVDRDAAGVPRARRLAGDDLPPPAAVRAQSAEAEADARAGAV